MSSTAGSAGSAVVPRVARVAGRIRVPGDKSISHRYAMLAALADGTSRLTGYAPGADCAATLGCLRALGVEIERGETIAIAGLGVGGLRPPRTPLDAVNSGTSMRLLSGIAAAHSFETTLVGDASLSRRPMRRVIEPLEQMGARIDSSSGCAPLTIHGGGLRAITFAPRVASAQVKSAVLLAGLQTAGTTTVVEPVRTRDHTERALEAFGARVSTEGGQISITGGQRLRATEAAIPGDFSSAMFWLALAAATPDSDVEIDGVGLNPSRLGALDVLRRAGARVTITPDAGHDDTSGGEPLGTIRLRYDGLTSFEIAPEEVAGLIDEIPALAAMAAIQAGITMTVRGAGELRVKESDRITMLARGFGAMGIAVEQFPDGFTLHGGPPGAGEPDAAGDHRLAMAFAVAGSRGRGPVQVMGADAVAVSYPGFFAELQRVAGRDAGRDNR